jgi:hypothetical protein
MTTPPGPHGPPAPGNRPGPQGSPIPQGPPSARDSGTQAERRTRPATVPGGIRLRGAAALVLVALLFGVLGLAVSNARNGLQVIGQDAGPQVVATADLYFALSDMDAQIAGVLLMGREHDLGSGRAAALSRYEQRRTEASRAVLQAAELAADDPTEQRTVQAVLDGLGRYEALAARALLLDEQAGHAAGPPPERVLALYRQATDLMRLDLLPKAYNLTLDSGTIVRRTYEAERSAAVVARVGVVLLGLAAIAVLIWLQVFLAQRFRRVFNPALVLATVVVGLGTLWGVSVLSTQVASFTQAKEDGFDSVLTLARARAVSNSLHADQSRYLLDPERADTYEQVYLDKSQSVFYVAAGNLDAYYAAVNKAVAAYAAPEEPIDFLGLQGRAAHTAGRVGWSPAMGDVLGHYQRFQQDDRRLRTLAGGGDVRGAITHLMTRVSADFGRYDEAMVELAGRHREQFDQAIGSAEAAAAAWRFLLPGGLAIAAVLIFAGVRPRLAEYR